MATIFQNQTEAFESSPVNGVADLRLAYQCTPKKGGQLSLFARETGASVPFVKIDELGEDTVKIFKATGLQYYVKYHSVDKNAVASLTIG